MKIRIKKLQGVNCHVCHNGITEKNICIDRGENEIARIVRYQLFSYQQMAVNNCLTLVVSCFFRTTVPQFISLYLPMIYVVHLSTASLPHCVLSYVDVERSSYVSSPQADSYR